MVCGTFFAGIKNMDRILLLSVIAFAAASVNAAPANAVPESQISTPAEQGFSPEKTTLSDKESADWQKKLEQRKMAREAILSRLRGSSAQEKEILRRELSKNREKSFQSERESSTKSYSPERPREDRDYGDPHDDPSMGGRFPGRDMPNSPPPGPDFNE